MPLYRSDGVTFKLAADLHIDTGAATFRNALEGHIVVPDPAIPNNPPKVWKKFLSSAPTIAPSSLTCNGGAFPLNNEAWCSVNNPGDNSWWVYMELWRADESQMISSAVTAPSNWLHVFSPGPSFAGVGVKFRAAYRNSGGEGPMSGFSNIHIIGSL